MSYGTVRSQQVCSCCVSQAEARLAAKRAARAEARDIRMRELERQQKEVRNTNNDLTGEKMLCDHYSARSVNGVHFMSLKCCCHHKSSVN